jgi:hypothetical protein
VLVKVQKDIIVRLLYNDTREGMTRERSGGGADRRSKGDKCDEVAGGEEMMGEREKMG